MLFVFIFDQSINVSKMRPKKYANILLTQSRFPVTNCAL